MIGRRKTPDDAFDDAFINYVGGLVDRVHGLETILKHIKENLGHVCAEFETCDHRACSDSCSAWLLADQALSGNYDIDSQVSGQDDVLDLAAA